MAGINATVRINDGMSPALKSMNKALNIVLSNFESLQSVSGKAIDVSSIEVARQELSNASEAIDNIENNIRKANDEQKKFNKSVGDGSGAMKSLASMAGKLISAYAVFNQVKKSIDYASDLTEVQNVVDVTFGEASKTIDAWAKTTLDAVGLNELSAKQYAGTMGAMLKSSGLVGGAVSDISMRLTELSGDMASFYNLTGEEAFNKIRSGISGETEPLKQLGINMSVANLEAYAMAQGIEKSYDSMSQAEQVLLRYNYLLSVTTDAQGDFERSAGTFANQTKTLSQRWEEFAGKLASLVLPVLTKVVDYMNRAITWLSENGDMIVVTIAAISGALIGYKVATTLATIAQQGFNTALYACPLVWILGIVIAIIGAVYGVVGAINKVTDSTISATGIIFGVLMVALSAIHNLFFGTVNAIIDILVILWNIIADLANFCGNVFNDPLKATVHLFFDMVDAILACIEAVANALDWVFGSNLGGAVSGWRKDLDGWVDDTFGTQQEFVTHLDAEALHMGEWMDPNEAWQSGYEAGDSLGDKFGTSAFTDLITDYAGDIADNTSTIADGLEITEEDLKYLRDIAEQEAVNRFTTAEIKIDMQNNNSINSNMDIDGIVTQLEDKLYESMTIAAEGVY